MLVSRFAMNGYGASEEHQPLTWIRGYPVYAAHFIVLVFVASLFATAALMAFNGAPLLNWITFSSEQVLKGQAWRIFTYGLVNPPSLKGLWFAVDMLMIVWFGRELEKFFGRRKFLGFFACIYLLTPLLFTALGPWYPMRLVGEMGAFALFIAFATLYPGAAIFFNLLAKWVALVMVGIYTLMALSDHDWPGLISLWATSGFAYGFVRYQQGLISLPQFRLPDRNQPKLRVLPDLEVKKSTTSRTSKDNAMAEMDKLLDKIAKSGLSSLSASERAKLDAARADLIKKDPR